MTQIDSMVQRNMDITVVDEHGVTRVGGQRLLQVEVAEEGALTLDNKARMDEARAKLRRSFTEQHEQGRQQCCHSGGLGR